MTRAGAVADLAVQVMTWNVQHASPARTRDQVDWVAARPDADVLILTEVSRGASLTVLTDRLRGHGYQVCAPDATQDRLVVLATRIGTATVIDGLYPGRLPHRALGVHLQLPHGGVVGLVGLYVPSRGPQARRNVDKRAFQHDVTALLPVLGAAFGPGTPVLVGGDLNVVEPGHTPHHTVFGAWEYAFYRAFGDAGFTDVFRHLHPDAEAHSWYGRSGRGYRFDYLFTTDADATTASAYVHDPRRLGLSDHAAHTTTLLTRPPA
jgi:exodeoxyribonuclease-3